MSVIWQAWHNFFPILNLNFVSLTPFEPDLLNPTREGAFFFALTERANSSYVKQGCNLRQSDCPSVFWPFLGKSRSICPFLSIKLWPTFNSFTPHGSLTCVERGNSKRQFKLDINCSHPDWTCLLSTYSFVVLTSKPSTSQGGTKRWHSFHWLTEWELCSLSLALQLLSLPTNSLKQLLTKSLDLFSLLRFHHQHS